jgi:Flp pilus assembly protein TadB
VSFKVSDSRGASSNFSEPIAIKIGHGVHVNISDLVAKIPPGVAMAGLVIVGIFLVVIITRALTIRRFKREHSDWD